MKQFAVVAIGAAMLAYVSGYRATALAQAPDPSTAQLPAAPAAQAPASPASTQMAPAAPEVQPSPAPVVAAVAQGGTLQGMVKASGVALPGVAVTATNTL